MPEWAEDDSPEEGTTYGLVMPFVVCDSQGGPYNSEAFVAGSRFGQDMATVKAGGGAAQSWGFVVPTQMVPQYDLMAMHFEFVTESEPWDEHPDEWTFVTFTRPTQEEPDA